MCSDRYTIAKHIAKLAKKEGANYVSHGCTGAGNDQVRIDVTLKTIAPNIKISAPIRELMITRPKEIEIPTVLRCKDYYYEQLDDHYSAIDSYRSISPEKRLYSECIECSKCEDVCPNGINITEKLCAANKIFEPLLA